MHCAEINSIPFEELKDKLGIRTATIVEELVKIGNLDTSTPQGQSENMRNLTELEGDFRFYAIPLRIDTASFPVRAFAQLE